MSISWLFHSNFSDPLTKFSHFLSSFSYVLALKGENRPFQKVWYQRSKYVLYTCDWCKDIFALQSNISRGKKWIETVFSRCIFECGFETPSHTNIQACRYRTEVLLGFFSSLSSPALPIQSNQFFIQCGQLVGSWERTWYPLTHKTRHSEYFTPFTPGKICLTRETF